MKQVGYSAVILSCFFSVPKLTFLGHPSIIYTILYTAEHPSQDTTTSTTTPITTTAPQGHFSTRPVEACDEAGAYEMLIGKGKFTCETKTKKKGFRKICTVECNDGHKQGPRKVRCKNYDNRQGTAFKYWHTTHKQKKIICN